MKLLLIVAVVLFLFHGSGDSVAKWSIVKDYLVNPDTGVVADGFIWYNRQVLGDITNGASVDVQFRWKSPSFRDAQPLIVALSGMETDLGSHTLATLSGTVPASRIPWTSVAESDRSRTSCSLEGSLLAAKARASGEPSTVKLRVTATPKECFLDFDKSFELSVIDHGIGPFFESCVTVLSIAIIRGFFLIKEELGSENFGKLLTLMHRGLFFNLCIGFNWELMRQLWMAAVLGKTRGGGGAYPSENGGDASEGDNVVGAAATHIGFSILLRIIPVIFTHLIHVEWDAVRIPYVSTLPQTSNDNNNSNVENIEEGNVRNTDQVANSPVSTSNSPGQVRILSPPGPSLWLRVQDRVKNWWHSFSETMRLAWCRSTGLSCLVGLALGYFLGFLSFHFILFGPLIAAIVGTLWLWPALRSAAIMRPGNDATDGENSDVACLLATHQILPGMKMLVFGGWALAFLPFVMPYYNTFSQPTHYGSLMTPFGLHPKGNLEYILGSPLSWMINRYFWCLFSAFLGWYMIHDLDKLQKHDYFNSDIPYRVWSSAVAQRKESLGFAADVASPTPSQPPYSKSSKIGVSDLEANISPAPESSSSSHGYQSELHASPPEIDCVICLCPIELEWSHQPSSPSFEFAPCNAVAKDPSEMFAVTPCEHVFHKVCLGEWLEVKSLCPVCRRFCPKMRHNNSNNNNNNNNNDVSTAESNANTTTGNSDNNDVIIVVPPEVRLFLQQQQQQQQEQQQQQQQQQPV